MTTYSVNITFDEEASSPVEAAANTQASLMEAETIVNLSYEVEWIDEKGLLHTQPVSWEEIEKWEQEEV